MSTPQFDASSDPGDLSRPGDSSQKEASGYRYRPFLGITFLCCQIYGRIYQNSECTAYVGHCPRCAKRVNVKIGPGGSSTRFFSAG
ncbi:hypothetical protein [Novipirellula rosea]|uniref:LITAF domain-containing protein n=1 Tax=Novipirellula rosea TaxID=1031540 RepID=A0ABP8NGP0_9BACT|tara:strand:- start:10387 stop:10644 length:258 start_codon:yes stop_codon:yes gene_type:complete